MAGEKKRRGRWAYLDDYKALANGEIVYTGKMYSWSGDTPWKKALAFLWLCGGVPGVCVTVCGLLPVSGMMNTFYVLLPWLLSFIGAGSVIWALCRLTYHGEHLREHVFKATVAALPVRAVFTAICAAVTVAGQTVKLILDRGSETPAVDACFLLLLALAAGFSAVLRPRSRALPFEPRP